MNRKSIIALAVACLGSTSSFAMTDTDGVLPPSGGGFIDARGDAGSGGFSGGGFGDAGSTAFDELERVNVTCSKVMCSTSSTFVGGTMMVTVGQAPLPPDPRGESTDTPEQQEAKKKACLDGCDIANKVNLNNCAQGLAKLNDQLKARPVQAGIGGAVAGAAATRNGVGAVAGAYIAWTLTNASNDKQLSNYSTNCLATAAKNNNYCIEQTCHAWFLAPLAMLRRRKKDDELATA